MIQVTMTEWNILTFIRAYKAHCGVAPMLSEIAEGIGVSRWTVARSMLHLSAKKLVTIRHGQQRGVTLNHAPTGVAP